MAAAFRALTVQGESLYHAGVKSALPVLAILLLVTGLFQSWDLALRSMGDDFYLYWAVPRSVARWGPVENVYSETARRRLSAEFIPEANSGHFGGRYAAVANRRQDFHAYQSPFLYLLMKPLARLDYETAFRIYQAAALIICAAGVVGWAVVLGHAWVVGALGAAVAMNWFEPCYSDIRVGNSNRIILAAVLLYVWIRSRPPGRFRDVAGGIVLGCTLMFKPVVIFVIPLLALWRCMNRRFAELAGEWSGLAVSGVSAFLLSTMAFGNQWFHWVEAVRTEPDEIIPVEHGNFAPAMLIKSAMGINSAMVIAAGLGTVTVIALILGQRRGGNTRSIFRQETIIVSAGLLLYLLSVRLVWMHYFLLTIPACLLLLNQSGKCRVSYAAATGAVLLMLSVNPLMLGVGVSSTFVVGVVVAVSTLVLFAMTLSLLFSPAADSKS